MSFFHPPPKWIPRKEGIGILFLSTGGARITKQIRFLYAALTMNWMIPFMWELTPVAMNPPTLQFPSAFFD